MKIQIDITNTENNNRVFDNLTISTEPFSYLGNGVLEITEKQLRILKLMKQSVFTVIEK